MPAAFINGKSGDGINAAVYGFLRCRAMLEFTRRSHARVAMYSQTLIATAYFLDAYAHFARRATA